MRVVSKVTFTEEVEVPEDTDMDNLRDEFEGDCKMIAEQNLWQYEILTVTATADD